MRRFSHAVERSLDHSIFRIADFGLRIDYPFGKSSLEAAPLAGPARGRSSEQTYAGFSGGLAQRSILARQRQLPPHGQLEIRRVVHGEILRGREIRQPRERERRRFVIDAEREAAPTKARLIASAVSAARLRWRNARRGP